jgi:hypothetical protein
VNISLLDIENETSYFNYTIYVGHSWSIKRYPPVLRNGELLRPYDGNDLYIFIVQYYDEDGDRPTLVEVIVENVSHTMWFSAGDPANGEYEYHVDLSEGIYTFYFVASDGLYTVRTENYTAKVPGKVTESEPEDDDWAIFLIVIIAIIIIMIFIFLYVSQRQMKRAKKVEEPQEPEGSKFRGRPQPLSRRGRDDRIRAQLAGKRHLPEKRELYGRRVRRATVPSKFGAPAHKKPGKNPILFEVRSSESCYICLGKIKLGFPAIRCTCGKVYHTSCAARVRKCNNCGTSLTNPESKLGKGRD